MAADAAQPKPAADAEDSAESSRQTDQQEQQQQQQQPASAAQSTDPDPKPDGGADNNKGEEAASQVTDEQWKAMFDVVMAIYDRREADGHDPSKYFQRSVNKRNVPDYYDVIKEPMALSVLKQKIRNRSYAQFSEFVRDCALIPHNAQTYNRPKSAVYEDAVVIREAFVSEFKKLVEQGIIPAETAELPDLGEIPEADPVPAEEEEEEEEEEEDEEEGEESDDEGARRKRRKGGTRPSKRDSNVKEEAQKTNDPELRKKRGRPPRVDTPMEARIKAVLKGIRKFKDTSGQLKVRHFEKLPDKTVYPDYFTEIKEPMAIDFIKRKSKRKKYNSVDHFMRDIDVMFNNAKQYNQPESQLYKDAEHLQDEAHKMAEQEKKKPDSEYLMEDGRLPLPNGIMHKGELWRVGDWVHIENPNDVTKPIVAQIYRTWQDSEGQQWVNACWYYRPEQTVHQFEKHFFPNEVVKTGQYRDHRIDEVVDRCFVMFFTRYNRGRPRDLPPDKEVYVCEARYNEEKHKLNKIKTWASCLPDEVREKDYEMDLFDAPRKIKKIPSPIKHLLKDDAKETDDVPKPTWGAENAPPIVGAVHRRPREENESPPPEPTPSPPPPPPPAPAAPAAPNKPVPPSPQPATRPQSQNSIRPATPAGANAMSALPKHSPTPHHTPRSSQPPVPLARVQQPQSQQHQQQPHATPQPHPGASTPSLPANYPARSNNLAPNSTPQPPPLAQGPSPQRPLSVSQQQQQPTPQSQAPPYSAPQNFPSYQGARTQSSQFQPSTYNPSAPRPVEAFRLNDNVNASIPAEIRSQCQCDNNGRVLFFTAPPLDVVSGRHGDNDGSGLAHSIHYLATKEERQQRVAERKRKLAEDQERQHEAVKRQRAEEDAVVATRVDKLTERAASALVGHIEAGTTTFYKSRYGDEAPTAKAADEQRGRERQQQQPEQGNDGLKADSSFISLRRSGGIYG